MNTYFEPGGPFERRRSNRAVLLVMAMAFAGIALSDGVRALMTTAVPSRPPMKRLVTGEDRGACITISRTTEPSETGR